MRPLRYLSLALQGNTFKPFLLLFVYADVAKLVDVPDLGSGAARRVGSSPSIRTMVRGKFLEVSLIGFFEFCVPILK